MKHAEICPICKGRGRVPEDPEWDSGPSPSTRVCHGCNGKGWIEVEGAREQPIRPWQDWVTINTGGDQWVVTPDSRNVHFDTDTSTNSLHTHVEINPEYLAGRIHG